MKIKWRHGQGEIKNAEKRFPGRKLCRYTTARRLNKQQNVKMYAYYFV